MPAWLGPAIAAGASLLGGSQSRKAAAKQAAADLAWQKHLAQNSVQMRVKDANAAGIHPLAALGMQSISYTPSMIDPQGGAGIAEAGQAIDRAITAGRSNEGRMAQLAEQLASIQVEGAGLDNEIKRAQLASEVRRSLGSVSTGTGPGIPDPAGNMHTPFEGMTPAQTYSDMYGDVLGELYGVGNYVRNLWENFGGMDRVTRDLEWLMDQIPRQAPIDNLPPKPGELDPRAFDAYFR